jgi:putative phosphoribosyl transferase
MKMPYENRAQAARELAADLSDYADRADVLVLGIPRGGVPVATVVARELGAAVDVMIVRKLGFPMQPELAMGAVASGGIRVMNPEVEGWVSEEGVRRVVEREEAEVRRRERTLRGERPPPRIRDRTVILVDDGLATGSTMRAAIQAVRAQDPREVVVAVPVAPPRTVRTLRREADEVRCSWAPEAFFAIGQFYRDFTQVSDEAARRLLEAAWAEREPERVEAGAPG